MNKIMNVGWIIPYLTITAVGVLLLVFYKNVRHDAPAPSHISEMIPYSPLMFRVKFTGDTNEWYRQIYLGEPTAVQVTNRICYSAEKWCERERRRSGQILYSEDTTQTRALCEQVLEDIRKRRITYDSNAVTNPIYWESIVYMSQRWYALPEYERVGKKWNIQDQSITRQATPR